MTLTLFSCGSPTDEFLLNEEFNHNSLGWTEEKTNSHHTEVIDGKLLILSLDTAAKLSSNGPMDNSVFWRLPNKFQFTTSMEMIDGGKNSGFGFILYSASLQYNFSLSKKGEVKVTEYDYNLEGGYDIMDYKNDSLEITYNSPVKLRLEVNSSQFEFYVNDKYIGKGALKAKGWQTVRLYATAGGTGIKADYYRLQDL